MNELSYPDGPEEHCRWALANAHAFLHGELPEADADEIRRHLMACESCMDNFDIEELIGALVKRCSGGAAAAPEQLRVRVSSMRVTARRRSC